MNFLKKLGSLSFSINYNYLPPCKKKKKKTLMSGYQENLLTDRQTDRQTDNTFIGPSV